MEPVGLEPTMPEAGDLQSPGVTNFPTTPLFGAGGETRTHTPKNWLLRPARLPITPRPHIF